MTRDDATAAQPDAHDQPDFDQTDADLEWSDEVFDERRFVSARHWSGRPFLDFPCGDA